MGVCENDVDQIEENSQKIQEWSDLASGFLIAVIAIYTTVLLYWKRPCRKNCKDIPLFVTLQIILLLINVPLILMYDIYQVLLHTREITN